MSTAAVRPPEKSAYYALFLRGGGTYGMALDAVREVIHGERLTVVPRAPAHLAGVHNLRGEVLPVVLADSWLLLPEQTYDEQKPILILRLKERLLGISVDQMLGVMDVPGNAVDPHPQAAQSPWLVGRTILPNGRTVDLLSGDRFLDTVFRQTRFAA